MPGKALTQKRPQSSGNSTKMAVPGVSNGAPAGEAGPGWPATPSATPAAEAQDWMKANLTMNSTASTATAGWISFQRPLTSLIAA
jgi:hypothetical protein